MTWNVPHDPYPYLPTLTTMSPPKHLAHKITFPIVGIIAIQLLVLSIWSMRPQRRKSLIICPMPQKKKIMLWGRLKFLGRLFLSCPIQVSVHHFFLHNSYHLPMFLVSLSTYQSCNVLFYPFSDNFHSPVLYQINLGVTPLDSMDTRRSWLEIFTLFKNTLEALLKEMGT